MRIFYAALCFSAVMLHGAAAEPFLKWWPGFQSAVAQSEAKTVAEGVSFPLNWENGPVRLVRSRDEFIQNFHKYMTPEICRLVGSRKPVRMPNGVYIITWKARGNEYSLDFKPGKAGTYVLDGLSEGPP